MFGVLQISGAEFRVGIAQVDVTPGEPIRLTGYASRQTNSVGVEQRLWAKGLTFGVTDEDTVLVVTLDNCGIAESTYRSFLDRVGKKTGLTQPRIALCMSHTHSGPCTRDWAPNIFIRDLPADQLATINRYTDELLNKLEQVAVDAMADRKPGTLAFSEGRVEFARNRRTAGGPVDHALGVLFARDAQGQARAVLANYACHCTTLGGDFNRVCGDWAGFAQEEIARLFPGAVSMISIGCGADANPHPRGGPDAGLALAKQHGVALASEVRRLVKEPDTRTELSGAPRVRLTDIRLPFGPHFTRAQWEERAKKPAIVGYHARKNLARLERGEQLPSDLYYPIVTWEFRDGLSWVFLPGEVVVDYALKIKAAAKQNRTWVTAYANYVPCYIPSRRILSEGGYEAEESLWYYDRPARLALESEDLILRAVAGTP